MKAWLNALVLAAITLATTSAAATPINVLWYTGGVANTPSYEANINNLIGDAAAAPGNNSWSITYWDNGPMPSGSYNTLVVASPQGGWDTYPNYGPLVAAAPTFGSRVMVTGQDADWHYLNGPGPSSFNGPQEFLVDAINWASFGSGMGAVLLGANSQNYSSEGGNILTTLSGLGTETDTTTESVNIPQTYASFPINKGLTSAGLSNWLNSAHNSWTGTDPSKWTPINTTTDGSAVTLVSAAPAGGATAPPALPPSAPSPVNFQFPLQAVLGAAPPTNRPAYQLITEAGGRSANGSTDLYHINGGFYSLDFQANEKADVVAAAAGLVTRVCSTYVCTGPHDPGPVVDIYNGDGYFTEYREFTKDPVVHVGEYVRAGQKIGDFIPYHTNNIINTNGHTALHFQVKYTKNFLKSAEPCPSSGPCRLLAEAQAYFGSGTGLSAANVPELQKVTLDGKGLTSPSYTFSRTPTPRSPVIQAVGPPASDSSLTRIAVPSFDTFSAIDTTISGATAILSEHSPAYLWDSLTMPTNAEYLSFDYFWPRPGDGDYLSVFFGKNLLGCPSNILDTHLVVE